ncbi:MAG: hypothetical protein JW891_13920 [Candidatus Lokiarchaeota archaeon]|nr:hypothetical protein [Candidatus Lokiarchaeota archaeon]
MDFETNEIEVTCPFCKAIGKIKIPVAIFKHKKWGTIKVQVPAGAICKDHHFIVLLDSQGIVRGHEKIEYLMSPIVPKESAYIDIKLGDFISIFGKKVIMHLLHALIFKYKAYVIKNNFNKEFIKNLDSFLKFLFRENHHHDNLIFFIDKIELSKVLRDEPGVLIIGIKNEILQCPWKGRLDFIKTNLNIALEIINPAEQLILLQQELSKFTRLAEGARKILEHGRLISKSEFLAELQHETKLLHIDKDILSLIKNYIDRHYSPSYWELIG